MGRNRTHVLVILADIVPFVAVEENELREHFRGVPGTLRVCHLVDIDYE